MLSHPLKEDVNTVNRLRQLLLIGVVLSTDLKTFVFKLTLAQKPYVQIIDLEIYLPLRNK